MNLKDKTILITGATGGIGSVLSQKLKDLGSNIITIGRDPNKPATYHADLSDKENRAELIRQILKDYEKIDILINNAGIGYYDLLTEIDESEWYQSYELNVHTPILLTKGLYPLLQKSSQSLIMNIGSVAGYTAKSGRTTYNSTKFALRGATLCLALEHTNKNPSFTYIALDSTLTPFGPWSLEQKMAKASNGKIYLASDWVASELINIMQADSWKEEYTLSETDYGFGEWHKP